MKRIFSAKKIVGEIKSGVSDAELMKKYGLSKRELRKVFHKLQELGRLDRRTLELRNRIPQAARESSPKQKDVPTRGLGDGMRADSTDTGRPASRGKLAETKAIRRTGEDSPEETRPIAPSVPAELPSGEAGRWMRMFDLLVTCWRMVSRNWARYRPVMIAIGLGTIGFIMIRTLSESVEKKITNNLDLIGEATVLTVSWDDRRSESHQGEYSPSDVLAVERVPHVMKAALYRYTVRDLKLHWHTRKADKVQVTAVDQSYWQTTSQHCAKGRLITGADVARQNKVCVLGASIREELFGDSNPIGQVVEVEGYRYPVVGYLAGPAAENMDRSVFIPLSLAPRYMGAYRQFVTMRVRVDDISKVRSIRRRLKWLLAARYPQYGALGVRVTYHSSRVARTALVLNLVKLFCYSALAAIFIVGKIGLTNVMMKAVNDRTREIGLRKAVGATDRMIRFQFMMESVFISFLAAIIGVAGGIFSVMLLKNFLGVGLSPSVLLGSIVVDMMVTLTIGVAAGMYPSGQAAALDIVTAMRYE